MQRFPLTFLEIARCLPWKEKCFYRKIPFPEDFIARRIKHGNQHTERKKCFLIGRFYRKTVFPRIRSGVLVLCADKTFLLFGHFACTFLIAGFWMIHAGGFEGCATVSGNPELTSIHHQQKRIRRDRAYEFSVSSIFTKNESKGKLWKRQISLAIRSADKAFVKNAFQTWNH